MLLRVVEETIFHSQYFWFYCFGALILIYVILAVYNRIKHSKQGTKTIKVKVGLVQKICTEAGVKIAGSDSLLWAGRASTPGTRFEVEFTGEENDEAVRLTVKEKECEKLKMGDTGILKYNGDEFISFVQG